MRWLGPLIVSIMIVLAGQALALPQAEADAAYARGDYATAFNLLLPLAEKGSVQAQDRIAEMYDKGLGVPQDSAKAQEWYRRASLQAARDAELQMEASQGLASQPASSQAPASAPAAPVVLPTATVTPVVYPVRTTPTYYYPTAAPARPVFVPVVPVRAHHHGRRH